MLSACGVVQSSWNARGRDKPNVTMNEKYNCDRRASLVIGNVSLVCDTQTILISHAYVGGLRSVIER